MSQVFIDTTALDRLIARLRTLEHLDPRPLLAQWVAIIIEDNRAGVLSGLNKDGEPVAPTLRYRNGRGRATRYRAARSGQTSSPGTAGGFQGLGSRPQYSIRGGRFEFRKRGAGQQTLANNNLSSSEYRKLTGPFAAPRRANSRIITNFVVRAPRQTDGKCRWVIVAGWKDVVDVRGRPFYPYLFAPPGRDMRGIRPRALQKCRAAMMAWLRQK